jgi:hypothetical protein
MESYWNYVLISFVDSIHVYRCQAMPSCPTAPWSLTVCVWTFKFFLTSNCLIYGNCDIWVMSVPPSHCQLKSLFSSALTCAPLPLPQSPSQSAQITALNSPWASYRLATAMLWTHQAHRCQNDFPNYLIQSSHSPALKTQWGLAMRASEFHMGEAQEEPGGRGDKALLEDALASWQVAHSLWELRLLVDITSLPHTHAVSHSLCPVPSSIQGPPWSFFTHAGSPELSFPWNPSSLFIPIFLSSFHSIKISQSLTICKNVVDSGSTAENSTETLPSWAWILVQ